MESSIITRKPELSKFSKFVKSRLDETPVIVDNKDHVRVGNYVCRQDSGQWTVSKNNEILETFTLRSSSVAWCIATIGCRSTQAKQVKDEDLKYGQVIEDSYIYLTRFKTTNDKFKKELMWIRYDDSMHKLRSVRARLTSFLKNLQVG